jgi:hypothetical protein
MRKCGVLWRWPRFHYSLLIYSGPTDSSPKSRHGFLLNRVYACKGNRMYNCTPITT